MGKSKKINYYAVCVGRNPGIYLTWKECEEQVKGFSNALYKGFETIEEAELYVAGSEDNSKLEYEKKNKMMNRNNDEERVGKKNGDFIAFEF